MARPSTGIMQLYTQGIQDYLLFHENPSVTFFKADYKRVSNFAVEPIELVLNSGSLLSVPQHGDLVSKVYWKIKLPSLEAVRDGSVEEIAERVLVEGDAEEIEDVVEKVTALRLLLASSFVFVRNDTTYYVFDTQSPFLSLLPYTQSIYPYDIPALSANPVFDPAQYRDVVTGAPLTTYSALLPHPNLYYVITLATALPLEPTYDLYFRNGDSLLRIATITTIDYTHPTLIAQSPVSFNDFDYLLLPSSYALPPTTSVLPPSAPSSLILRLEQRLTPTIVSVRNDVVASRGSDVYPMNQYLFNDIADALYDTTAASINDYHTGNRFKFLLHDNFVRYVFGFEYTVTLPYALSYTRFIPWVINGAYTLAPVFDVTLNDNKIGDFVVTSGVASEFGFVLKGVVTNAYVNERNFYHRRDVPLFRDVRIGGFPIDDYTTRFNDELFIFHSSNQLTANSEHYLLTLPVNLAEWFSLFVLLNDAPLSLTTTSIVVAYNHTILRGTVAVSEDVSEEEVVDAMNGGEARLVLLVNNDTTLYDIQYASFDDSAAFEIHVAAAITPFRTLYIFDTIPSIINPSTATFTLTPLQFTSAALQSTIVVKRTSNNINGSSGAIAKGQFLLNDTLNNQTTISGVESIPYDIVATSNNVSNANLLDTISANPQYVENIITSIYTATFALFKTYTYVSPTINPVSDDIRIDATFDTWMNQLLAPATTSFMNSTMRTILENYRSELRTAFAQELSLGNPALSLLPKLIKFIMQFRYGRFTAVINADVSGWGVVVGDEMELLKGGVAVARGEVVSFVGGVTSEVVLDLTSDISTLRHFTTSSSQLSFPPFQAPVLSFTPAPYTTTKATFLNDPLENIPNQADNYWFINWLFIDILSDYYTYYTDNTTFNSVLNKIAPRRLVALHPNLAPFDLTSLEYYTAPLPTPALPRNGRYAIAYVSQEGLDVVGYLFSSTTASRLSSESTPLRYHLFPPSPTASSRYYRVTQSSFTPNTLSLYFHNQQNLDFSVGDVLPLKLESLWFAADLAQVDVLDIAALQSGFLLQCSIVGLVLQPDLFKFLTFDFDITNIDTVEEDVADGYYAVIAAEVTPATTPATIDSTTIGKTIVVGADTLRIVDVIYQFNGATLDHWCVVFVVNEDDRRLYRYVYVDAMTSRYESWYHASRTSKNTTLNNVENVVVESVRWVRDAVFDGSVLLFALESEVVDETTRQVLVEAPLVVGSVVARMELWEGGEWRSGESYQVSAVATVDTNYALTLTYLPTSFFHLLTPPLTVTTTTTPAVTAAVTSYSKWRDAYYVTTSAPLALNINDDVTVTYGGVTWRLVVHRVESATAFECHAANANEVYHFEQLSVYAENDVSAVVSISESMGAIVLRLYDDRSATNFSNFVVAGRRVVMEGSGGVWSAAVIGGEVVATHERNYVYPRITDHVLIAKDSHHLYDLLRAPTISLFDTTATNLGTLLSSFNTEQYLQVVVAGDVTATTQPLQTVVVGESARVGSVYAVFSSAYDGLNTTLQLRYVRGDYRLRPNSIQYPSRSGFVTTYPLSVTSATSLTTFTATIPSNLTGLIDDRFGKEVTVDGSVFIVESVVYGASTTLSLRYLFEKPTNNDVAEYRLCVFRRYYDLYDNLWVWCDNNSGGYTFADTSKLILGLFQTNNKFPTRTNIWNEFEECLEEFELSGAVATSPIATSTTLLQETPVANYFAAYDTLLNTLYGITTFFFLRDSLPFNARYFQLLNTQQYNYGAYTNDYVVTLPPDDVARYNANRGVLSFVLNNYDRTNLYSRYEVRDAIESDLTQRGVLYVKLFVYSPPNIAWTVNVGDVVTEVYVNYPVRLRVYEINDYGTMTEVKGVLEAGVVENVLATMELNFGVAQVIDHVWFEYDIDYVLSGNEHYLIDQSMDLIPEKHPQRVTWIATVYDNAWNAKVGDTITSTSPINAIALRIDDLYIRFDGSVVFLTTLLSPPLTTLELSKPSITYTLNGAPIAFTSATTASDFNASNDVVTINTLQEIWTEEMERYYNYGIVVDVLETQLRKWLAGTLVNNVIDTYAPIVALIVGDENKETWMNTAGKALVQGENEAFDVDMAYYRGCILTVEELERVRDAVEAIDALSGADLALYNQINTLYSLLGILLYHSTSLRRDELSILQNFVRTYLNYPVVTAADVAVLSNNNATEYFDVVRECVVDVAEAKEISDFKSNVIVSYPPLTLEETPNDTLRRRTTNDSGLRLFRNCVMSAAEEAQLLLNIVPSSLLVIDDNNVVRRTDLFGFSYDRNTAILTRHATWTPRNLQFLQTLQRFLVEERDVTSLLYGLCKFEYFDWRSALRRLSEKSNGVVASKMIYDDNFFLRNMDRQQNFDARYLQERTLRELSAANATLLDPQRLEIDALFDPEIQSEVNRQQIEAYIADVERKSANYEALRDELALIATLPERGRVAWKPFVGFEVVESVELLIDDQVVDERTGRWLRVEQQLRGNRNRDKSVAVMTGNVPALTTYDRGTKPEYTLYMDSGLWFGQSNVVALPMIALVNSDVKLRIRLRPVEQCIQLEKYYRVTARRYSTRALINYVYLNSEERRKFAQHKHEYLIENVQYAPEAVLTQERNDIEMGFINCCKDIVWEVVPLDDDATLPPNPIVKAMIELNGAERTDEMDGDYFQRVVFYEYHRADVADNLYAYSFALDPNALHPTGTCNMSMMRTKRLILYISPEHVNRYKVRIYARSFNLLRIMGGQAGLTYIV